MEKSINNKTIFDIIGENSVDTLFESTITKIEKGSHILEAYDSEFYFSKFNLLSEEKQEENKQEFVKDVVIKISDSLNNSKDDIIMEIKKTKGSFRNFKFHDEIFDILMTLEEKYKDNEKVTQLQNLYSSLQIKEQEYKEAFKDERTVGKMIYTLSATTFVFETLRFYFESIDPTESKNSGQVVLKEIPKEAINSGEIKMLNRLSTVQKDIINKEDNKFFLLIANTVLNITMAVSLTLAIYYFWKVFVLYSEQLSVQLYNYLDNYTHIKRAINSKDKKLPSDELILKIVDKIEKVRDTYFRGIRTSEPTIKEVLKDVDKASKKSKSDSNKSEKNDSSLTANHLL